MSANEMSLDEFLGHSSGGNRGKFLKGWRDRTPPAVNTWLHTRASIVALWRHGFPRFHNKKDKNGGGDELVVYGANYNCHESEKVLKDQYKRDDNGMREVPPTKCPFCMCQEYVRQMIEQDEISIVEPLFKFVPDREDEVIIHAGGFCGLFNDKLSDEEKKLLRDNEIFLKDAWKENSMSKLSYLFSVVDHDEPGTGAQIAIESALLGDKVKGVIRDTIEALGKEDGDPRVNPYAIRWVHRPKEKQFNLRYHAIRMEKLELTEEIERLIREDDPPDISNIIEKFNPGTMRSLMEKQCLIDLPWDDWFPEADAEQEQEEQKPPARQSRSAGTARAKEAPKPKEEPADDDKIECDECQAEMDPTDTQCTNCGKVYEEGPAPSAPAKKKPQAAATPKRAAEPPAPPPLPKREAKPAAKAPPAAAQGRRKPAAPPPEAEEPPPDDDIPFN